MPTAPKSYAQRLRALRGPQPDNRPNAATRGYDWRWKKARDQHLIDEPLCRHCKHEGFYTRATVVDHIIPHRGDYRLFWDAGNWQSLCKLHHDQKTGRGE